VTRDPTTAPTPDPSTDPSTDPEGPRPQRSALRLTLQALGFLIGIGLLAWVVSTAFSAMTAEDWERLRNASPLRLAGLVGLGGLSVALNGLIWWLCIRPVRRVGLADVTAVNAVATLLAYAPFKLSVLFRVTWHRAVDRIPMLTFGGWAVAIVATLAAGLGPAVALRLTPLRDHDAAWLAAAVVGTVLAALAGAAISASLATGAGWRTLRRVVFRLRGRAGIRLIRGRLFTNVHAATHMLAAPHTVAAASLVRLLDGLSIGARFLIAAAILAADVDPGTAMVVGVCFFVIGAVAPTGAAGVREGGTAGVFALLGVTDAVAPVVVFVAATQILGELLVGVAAAAWLGPGKLTRLTGIAAENRPPEAA